MRDPNIVEAYTDLATGVEFECVGTTSRGLLWGAWHPAYMGKPCMTVDATPELALDKLCAKYPQLARKVAA